MFSRKQVQSEPFEVETIVCRFPQENGNEAKNMCVLISIDSQRSSKVDRLVYSQRVTITL